MRYIVRDLGLLNDNYTITKSTVIGEKFADDEYVFNKDNIIGDFKSIPDLLDGKIGLEQLVENGYIKLLSQKDINDDGLKVSQQIDNPKSKFRENLVGQAPLPCTGMENKSYCEKYDSFLVLKPISKLPNNLTGDDAVRLYFPADIPAITDMQESQAYILEDVLKDKRWPEIHIGK